MKCVMLLMNMVVIMIKIKNEKVAFLAFKGW